MKKIEVKKRDDRICESISKCVFVEGSILRFCLTSSIDESSMSCSMSTTCVGSYCGYFQNKSRQYKFMCQILPRKWNIACN